MTRPVLRFLAVWALALQFLWPRYLFLSVAGKGISGYTLLTIVLFLAAIATLTINHVLQRAVLASIRRSGMVVLMFSVLWAWRLMCDITGIHAGSSISGTIIDFLYLGSWFISGIIIFSDERTRSALPYIVALCAIIAGLFGYIEYSTGTPVSQLFGFSRFATGDTYALETINRDLARAGESRIRSLYSHPLVYGQMMAGLAPFALHLLFRPRWWNKLLGLLSGGAILMSVALSNARSPLIVLAVAAVVFGALFLFDLRNKARLFLAVFCALGALLFVPVAMLSVEQLTQGRTAEESVSSTARSTQWDRGTTALHESPFTGFGKGSALEYAATLSGGSLLRASVDNYYLTFAVENGYVGLVFFFLLLATMSFTGLRVVYSARTEPLRSLNCACTATIISLAAGLIVLSITDTLSVIFQMTGFIVASAGAVSMTRGGRSRARRPSLRNSSPAAT